MKPKDSETREIDPIEQLELLKRQCNNLTPIIYRTYALYLQILRSLLLNSVRSAILSLITNQGYSDSEFIQSGKSKSCQVMVDKLVNRCNCLLTIEHIIDLTRQLEKDNKILIENTRQQINPPMEKDNTHESDYIEHQEEVGDIELGSNPPIDNPSQIDSWFISDVSGKKNEMNANQIDHQVKLGTDLPGIDKSDSETNSLLNQPEKSDIGNDEKLNLLQSFLSIASNAFESKKTQEIDENDFDDFNSNSEIKHSVNCESDEYLPDNPQALAEWINSFELALSRRLRNLSHALNVELLRAGIVNSIVPVSILDAVLSGHMQSEYSESNLLRISLPASPSAIGDGLDIMCLLLRLSELEFDNPQLRNCRSDLKKHQKQILKMVRQQRHWQGRSLANELKRNWWQNPSETSQTNTPMN